MPTGDDGAWIAQARTVPSFECDAVFAVEPSVYIGPDNGMSRMDWETANVRLPPVELARRAADRITTKALLGREAALLAHYRRVIAVAERYGKTRSLRPFPYFRVQPEIVADGQTLTSFSWVDDAHATRTVLDSLVEAASGPARLVHSDLDQGWAVLIVATGSATCLVEWDAEGPPPAGDGLAFDPAELARQASAARSRLQTIHSRLVSAIGRDGWT